MVKALVVAAEAHKHQTRGSSGPYINHIIECMEIAIKYGLEDNKIMQAIILHDILEDCDPLQYSKDILSSMFDVDAHVLQMVQDVTDDKNMTPSERKHAKLYCAQTNMFSVESCIVLLVDKMSNIVSLFKERPSNWSIKELLGYALWVKKLTECIRDAKADEESTLHNAMNSLATDLLAIIKSGIINNNEMMLMINQQVIQANVDMENAEKIILEQYLDGGVSASE